jgi:hypothetical protein
VPDLLGPGQAGVLVGDQQNNSVTVQAPSANGDRYTPVQTLGASSSASTQLAPGDVQWAILDKGATLPDAIVVSTGSNSVEIYRTTSIKGGAPTFASAVETYFVGTAPGSVTVADINGDGIPDLLITNQGSNDVSVLFGSYNAQGDWVGVPGPRLKSGGDGPIAVTVLNLGAGRNPDLAVFNGGSGTVTALPGVGQGFFDDQHPQTLFNLGSALVQPPTFVGTSGLGYVVTAGGNLVRFDLDHPAAGSSVVFSGQQVLAAQALPNGQVVVALVDGAVNVLSPKGSALNVASELVPQGQTTPALPSAIDVVVNPNGNFEVLVSSQGSDILSVFAASEAATGTIGSSLGGTSPPELNSFEPFNSTQAPTATGSQFVILTSATNATSASTASASASSSASTSSGALSIAVTAAVGLSLGGFSSVGYGSTTETSDAVLVSVEGNTYLNVPILDFGSERGEDAGSGGGRMPWLSALHPFGDTSSLTRFVIGLDEALRSYSSSEEEPPGNFGQSHDPWNEDLFYQHLPVRPQVLRQETNDSMKGGSPEAMLVDPPENPLDGDRALDARFRDQASGAPGVRASSHAARIVAGFKVASGLLAAMLLTPAFSKFVSRLTKQSEKPIESERVARS